MGGARGYANRGTANGPNVPVQGNFDAAFNKHKTNQNRRLANEGIREPKNQMGDCDRHDCDTRDSTLLCCDENVSPCSDI